MAILKKLVAAIKKFLRGKNTRRKKRRSLKKTRSPRQRNIRGKRPGQIRSKKAKRRLRKHKALRKSKKSKRRPKGRRTKTFRRKKTFVSRSQPKASQGRTGGRSTKTGSSKKVALPKKTAIKRIPSSPGVLAGEITHYFSKIEVAVIKITQGSIKVGDRIRIKGHTTDFVQRVASIQIESVNVPIARKGQLIGLKVDHVTRAGDLVYKI